MEVLLGKCGTICEDVNMFRKIWKKTMEIFFYSGRIRAHGQIIELSGLPEGRNLLKMRKHMANAKLMPTPK